MINPKTKQRLEIQQYGLAGKHSSVKICHWTKKSLRDEDVCYKEKFYGVHCHKCAQITPATLWCPNKCVFCWRVAEYMSPNKAKLNDPPEKIVKEIIEQRKKLLIGFKGNKKTRQKKLEDALIPNHWAISLAGEPCLYSKLPQLIKLLKTKYKAKTIYLVTNGLYPAMLNKLIKTNSLPTQLYISMFAPNKELYKKISKSSLRTYWSRYLKSLEIMKKLRGKINTVIRMTLIKDWNMANPEEYLKLIKIANPKYIEVKAYSHLGFSRKRLNKENMSSHQEIKQFAQKLCKLSNYKIKNEKKESRIVLLKN
ncbi:4-demethylwyosine synthase TYW1 [Nanoarchaeota archaeon]